MYLINDVSRSVDLSQKRIREYEKEGFIRPRREARTNNRLYSEFEVAQIRRITQLIHEHGFTLACLRNLLVLAPCWNIFACAQKERCAAFQDPHRPCWDIRQRSATLCAGPCDHCALWLARGQERMRILESGGRGPMEATP